MLSGGGDYSKTCVYVQNRSHWFFDENRYPIKASAFPESGRSGTAKTTGMRGRLRPEADITHHKRPSRQCGLKIKRIQRITVGAKKLRLNLSQELEIANKLFLKVMIIHRSTKGRSVSGRVHC